MEEPAAESPKLWQSSDQSQKFNPAAAYSGAPFCQNCAVKLETARIFGDELAVALEKYRLGQQKLERADNRQERN